MPAHSKSDSVNDAFFQPIRGLAASSLASQSCPKLSDENWILSGLHRVIESVPSGRGFLQDHSPRLGVVPSVSNYFGALADPRRLQVLRDVNEALVSKAALPDRLAPVPELARYDCFAMDGHWHRAAAHDEPHKGSKMAVGHCYSLDLRGHQLRHLAVAQGLHEHDLSMLKRIKPSGLRQGVPKGRRVIVVYDRACIDFDFWKRCRQECAVYFLSRPKEGLVFGWLEERPIDRSDPRNGGVLEDHVVLTRKELRLRLIRYLEPENGTVYHFLTNEPDLPPGVLVELYRRRWELEKTFDEIKNKLDERKAWATTEVAKAAQGSFVALAHNLLLLYEHRIEQEHGVTNRAEDERRARRQADLQNKASSASRETSTLLLSARRATQRSVKFIRWLRYAMREKLAEAAAVPQLRVLYNQL